MVEFSLANAARKIAPLVRLRDRIRGAELRRFNEAVNFEKEPVFVAIPKTGSTSIRRQPRGPGPYLISNPHQNIAQIQSGLYTYLPVKHLELNGSFPTIIGWIFADSEIRRKTDELFEKHLKFSLVRNPWARAASLYFRREGVKVSERMSFEQFCEQLRFASDTCSHPTLHENQVDWLLDANGDIAVDFVMRLEQIDHDLQTLHEMSDGRLNLQPLVRNKNKRFNFGYYHPLYNDSTRKIVSRLFESDIDTFKYTL